MLFYHTQCMFVNLFGFFFYWRGINCDGVQTLWKVFRLFPKAGLAIITGQWVFTTIFLTFRENDSKSRVGYFRNQEVKEISQERKKTKHKHKRTNQQANDGWLSCQKTRYTRAITANTIDTLLHNESAEYSRNLKHIQQFNLLVKAILNHTI